MAFFVISKMYNTFIEVQLKIKKMKKYSLIITVIFAFFFSEKVTAQELVRERNSVSFSAFGTSAVFGLTYERTFNHRFMAEVGVGIVGYGFGVTYFFNRYRINRINLYTGVKYNDNSLNELDDLYDRKAYIPIGISYPIKWNSLYASFDMGPAFIGNGYLGNFKVGLRF